MDIISGGGRTKIEVGRTLERKRISCKTFMATCRWHNLCTALHPAYAVPQLHTCFPATCGLEQAGTHAGAAGRLPAGAAAYC